MSGESFHLSLMIYSYFFRPIVALLSLHTMESHLQLNFRFKSGESLARCFPGVAITMFGHSEGYNLESAQ